MSLTKSSPHFERMMQEQMREDDTSYERYQEEKYLAGKTEEERLISDMDATVDTYQGAKWSFDDLIILRRTLAVTLYRLSAKVRDAHNGAGLAYIHRKFEIAKNIVDAMTHDAKLSATKAETMTEALERSKELRANEVMAEAHRESLRAKIDAAKAVLASMQQEIADGAQEKRNTHFQSTNT